MKSSLKNLQKTKKKGSDLFYDDFGDQIEAEFFNMRELLMCIHSVRLVELESEIVD